MRSTPRLLTQVFRGFVHCFRVFGHLLDGRPAARPRPGRSTIRLGVEVF